MALRGSVFLIIVLCVIAQPAVVPAQRFELTPYVGYAWGGEFKGGTYFVGDEVTVSDLQVNDSPTYGLYFSYVAAPTVYLELMVEAQPTSLKRTGDSELSDSTLFDLSLYFIHGGLLFEFGNSERDLFRPFFGFMLGVTRLDPDGSRSTATQFSGSLSLGFKSTISDLIAIRVQGRYSITFLGEGAKYFCDEDDQCQSYPAATYLTQGDVSLGLVFSF